jgi:anti-sigma factor RsiW
MIRAPSVSAATGSQVTARGSAAALVEVPSAAAVVVGSSSAAAVVVGSSSAAALVVVFSAPLSAQAPATMAKASSKIINPDG